MPSFSLAGAVEVLRMVFTGVATSETFDTLAKQQAIRNAIRRPVETALPYGDEELETSIVDRFERMVQAMPGNEVVRSTSASLTYSELNHQANRIAHAILKQTAGEVRPIGLMFEHGVEMISALVGVLKSGCFYVPLDPTYPENRLKAMAVDSGLEIVVTDDANETTARALLGKEIHTISLGSIPADIPDSNPDIKITPDHYAYLLYTSGSTGTPKGVVENHRDVKWFSGAFLRYDWVSPSDVASGFWSLSFSGFAASLYMCLLGGSTLLVIDPKSVGAVRMVELIRSNKISYLSMGPPLFRKLFEVDPERDGMPDIRIARFGGSGADPADIENFFKWAPAVTLRHSFGASEIKHVCSYMITADSQPHGESIPIGYPVDGIEIVLQNESGEPVPDGEVGEIVIRSRFNCPGYWNRPDLTAERFYGDESGGPNRYYRTGDLGIRDSNGCLFHRGRKDFQVKVRGYRVEIPEVEEKLKAISSVKDAVVVGQADGEGDVALVSFIIPNGEMPASSALRQELSISLPHYMMPSRFIKINQMPETPNGKLDRKAFPEVELKTEAAPQHVSGKTEATTDTEKRMCKIWEDALQKEQIGVDEDYFDIGGDSLMAAVIFDQVFRVFGSRIAINALFEAPTITELAAMIDQSVPESTPVVPIRPSGSKTPIFCFHSLGGSVLGYYGLAKYLPTDYPVWAIQPRGVDGREKTIPTIPGMAAYYASVITRIQENGPFIVTGISLGGVIAFEVARELLRLGREVQKLVLIDSAAPLQRPTSTVSDLWDRTKKFRQNVSYLPYELRNRRLPPEMSRGRIFRNNIRASRIYRRSVPEPVNVPVALIRADENDVRHVSDESVQMWRELTRSDIQIADVHGAHVGENYVLDEPNVEKVAKEFLKLVQEG